MSKTVARTPRGRRGGWVVMAGCCMWATTVAAQVPERTSTQRLPTWVLSAPRQVDALFGIGSGHSLEAADDAARLDLAKQVRVSVSEAFQLWEREARDLAPGAEWESPVPEGREVDVSRRLRVDVESTELRGVEIVERFVDGQTFYSLAQLDLLVVAREVQSLLARSSALAGENYGEALRLALRAGHLSLLLEAGRAPLDSFVTVARSQVRRLLEGIHMEIAPRELDWREETSGPLQLAVRLTANDAYLDLPIRAGFVAGIGTVRIDPPTDRAGPTYVSVLSVARTGARTALRVEVDLNALSGDSTGVLWRFPGAPATEVELQVPRTRAAVIARTDDAAAGGSIAATSCIAGELARFGYEVEALTGPLSTALDRASSAGVQVVVEVSSSVNGMWPITLSRQQAAAGLQITVYSAQRHTTSASLAVSGIRATGATPEAAREAALERACREAAQRLREIPRWDLP
jgi:LPP20 lipoprotein